MAKIPTILEPGRADGKLATSGAIFDENKGMFQSEINDIQDTLNSDNPNKPLSAKQGKVLKELLNAKVIEVGAVPIDTKPTEGNTTHVVNSDGLAKEFNKCKTTIITTDRIEDGAVTTEKIATTAFDSTLSVSGKIAPADVVGRKLIELEEEKLSSVIDLNTFYITDKNGHIISKIDKQGVHSVDFIGKDGIRVTQKIANESQARIVGDSENANSIIRETERAKKEESKKLDSKIENDTFLITDSKGFIIAKIDNDGIHSVNIDESPNIIESDTFLITDAKGFIAVKIDNNGVHTAMTEGKDAIACMVIGENYYPNNAPVRDTNGRITNADVTFSTGVKGNITITYDGDYAKTIKVKYNKENYNINIDRDNKGNINKVNIL